MSRGRPTQDNEPPGVIETEKAATTEITVTYQLSHREFIQIWGVYNFRRHLGREIPLVGAVLLALTVAGWLLTPVGLLIWLVLAGSITLLLIFFAAYSFVYPYFGYRLNPALRRELLITFGEESIRARAGEDESATEWSLYKKAIKTSNGYMIMREGGQAIFVPRRAFASREQETAFRALLRKKLNFVR